MDCEDVAQKPDYKVEPLEQQKILNVNTQQSAEISPSKVNGERSPARIIASKQTSMVDNNS